MNQELIVILASVLGICVLLPAPTVDPRLRLLPLLWVGLVFGFVALSLCVVLSIVEMASRQGFIFLCFVTAVCAAVSIPSLVCYLVGSRRRK